MRLRICAVACFAVLALVLSACAKEETSDKGGAKREGISIQVVTHGQASDPFWSVVKNGVDAAKDDMGVEVTYSAPEKFDVVKMRQLIDSAIAKKPDGIAVSLPDPDALKGSVKKAVDAGIPVVTLNSGGDVSASTGALAHVGQSEREAGVAAGKRLKTAGATNALCINQEVGNAALDQRCDGFEEGLGGTVRVIGVDLADPTSARARVESVLKKQTDVDGILTLGPTGADPTIAALKKTGKFGDTKLGTFDLSPAVLEGVRDGDLLFAIDQQQFLQGYLPVQQLALYAQLGVRPVGDVRTGPGFVTKENAAKAIKLSKEGLR